MHCHDVHEGNDKATRPTKARELFALTGQTNTEEEKKYTGGGSPTPFYEDARCRIKNKRTAARLILETYQIVIIWQVLSCVKVPIGVYMELLRIIQREQQRYIYRCRMIDRSDGHQE